jgi:superfamily II DNA or RNA helicase/HKD family nuclease
VNERLSEGAYESLHTRALDRALRAVPEAAPHFDEVEPAEAPEVLARHVADVVRRALQDQPHHLRLEKINSLLAQVADDADVVVALEQLLALAIPEAPGVHRMVVRPATPLSDVALLTNTRGEPSLGAELRAELASADRVDLLCAFIRWHGIRILADELETLHNRGVPLRVITTTYRGATERRALDELVRKFGAEVRIRYDAQSTRLHAKAWLFRRNSGFDTGYVGSSNLSKSALLDGLEWNVRISAIATPVLVRKFEATFDTYWNDPDFRHYDPDRDAELLDRALASEGSSGGAIILSGLEVRPRPHQERILEALDAERAVHDRHRNLVVAATGTGKTVIAALDYQRLRHQSQGESLLFVAHRKEILDQALRTYREVLGDGTFGDLLVGGQRPKQWRHVFASVQSISIMEQLPQFDVVVIDEFHHAEAATYRRLLGQLHPGELLGLTATPERSDGVDVRSFFDGRTAYELPLGDALNQDLLCPFHYFGIADNTDLTAIEWSRGAYDVAGLSELYTGNDGRARLVLTALDRQVTDTSRMRALGFCVSVAHAEYMARVFTQAGISSRALSGQTPLAERAQAAAALRHREIRCLFTVDLFNEGVDLPDVDTLLLLRPTSSATLFLQQLGRGLRRTPGKAVLTVLDFIGQHRREYRFDLRYRALTGTSRSRLRQQIEHGFPFLPSGSQLVLDRVARDLVLDNVRGALSRSRRELVADVRSHGDLPLAEFLAASERELADVYGRPDQSWTGLRREAGLPTLPAGSDEDALLRRIVALSHADDLERLALYTRLLTAADRPSYGSLSPIEQALARMLFFTVWPNRSDFSSYDAGFAQLRAHPAVVAEIGELLAITTDRARHIPQPLDIPGVSLLSHASYRREEILAGIGWANWQRKPHGRAAGVAWAPETGVDALLVTLRKEERDFSPTTRYRDYPLAANLFHWESQNSTSRDSPTGRRYLAGDSRVLLFVRETRHDDLGSAPYLCLGEATLVEHRGERPIAITWRLHRPMPAEVFQQGAVAST